MSTRAPSTVLAPDRPTGEHWRDELEGGAEDDALTVLGIKYEAALADRYGLTVAEWRARPDSSRRALTFPVLVADEALHDELCALTDGLAGELLQLRALSVRRARAWAPLPVLARELADEHAPADEHPVRHHDEHTGPPGLDVRTRPAAPHGPPHRVAEWCTPDRVRLPDKATGRP